MSKKKFKGDGVYFTGKSSDDVTGSQYLVKFGEYQCLLECGLYQSSSNSYLDSYKVNSAKFMFKPSEIDFVFIAHCHIDHCGLIPRLYKEGFRGQIITTKNTSLIMKPLLLNSCHIISDEARVLSKRYKRDYRPLYEEQDVYGALSLIKTYDEYNTIFHLNDSISFQWLNNSHCLGSAQLQLILSNKSKTRKILYTSDIGALKTNNHYLYKTEIPKMYNDVTLMESTYGNAERDNKKDRNFDAAHLKAAINTVLDRKGTVILPCFSFSRTQELLTTLYELFRDDEDFDAPVIVDSQLSCDICRLYSDLLSGEDLNLWNLVCNWENVQFIAKKEDSQKIIQDPAPKIIISSSGFCTNGRIVKYLKQYIKDRNSMVIFSGYVGDNPSYLSYKIKNYKDYRYVSINKEKIKNNADCISLSTFSSHAGFKDLIRFGSSLLTNKLVLVHGSAESKKCLSEKLREAISRNNKTYRVISAFKGMVVHL